MVKELVIYMFSFLKNEKISDMIMKMMITGMFLSWVAVLYIVTFHFTDIEELVKKKMFGNQFLFEQSAESNRRINSVLNDFKQKLPMDVDRIYVERLHNNITDFNGAHFIYSSRTNEITSPGITHEVESNQDIPVSLFTQMSNEFLDDQCWIVDRLDENSDVFNFLSNQGVKSVIRCPIRDEVSGQIIGIVGIETVSSYIDTLNVKMATEELGRLAVRVSLIMALTFDIRK